MDSQTTCLLEPTGQLAAGPQRTHACSLSCVRWTLEPGTVCIVALRLAATRCDSLRLALAAVVSSCVGGDARKVEMTETLTVAYWKKEVAEPKAALCFHFAQLHFYTRHFFCKLVVNNCTSQISWSGVNICFFKGIFSLFFWGDFLIVPRRPVGLKIAYSNIYAPLGRQVIITVLTRASG